MDPITRKRTIEGCFRLGNFVLVVRKHQISAAAVDVKRLSEILGAHCRTFDVPTRPTGTPWAIPSGFARLARARLELGDLLAR